MSPRCFKDNRRTIIIVSVFFFVVVFCLILGITLSKRKSAGTTAPEIRLGDILPHSFSAVYDVHKRKASSWKNIQNRITIEWDRDLDELRYLETDANNDDLFKENLLMSYSLDFNANESLTNLVAINEEAVMNIFNPVTKTWTWSCFGLNGAPFYYIILFAVNATKVDNSEVIECTGNVWISKCNCCSPVYFCVKDASILSVKQGNMSASLRSWKSPALKTIHLPQHNVSCKNMTSSSTTTKPSEYIEDELNLEDVSATFGNFFFRKRKECIFVHGVGVDSPKTGYEILDRFTEYWGTVHNHVPRCSEKKFIKFETVQRGWDNADLQQSFCNVVTTPHGNDTISDKIIFAHSMGNLVIAAALHRGICKLDLSTTEWYAIQAPWRGSRVADKLYDLCAYQIGVINGYIDPRTLFNVLKATKYCTWGGEPSPAFKTLSPRYIARDGTHFSHLVNIGELYVTGGLCGDSSWGMGKDWLESSALSLTQFLADLEDPNDGVVAYSESCRLLGPFLPNYKSRFYLGKINHLEGTCRHGDNDWCPWWWEEEKLRPCLWFENL